MRAAVKPSAGATHPSSNWPPWGRPRIVSMNATILKRASNPSPLWLAQAAAVITTISLQLVWVGVFLCTVECAKGTCPGEAAGGAETHGGHCCHSGSAHETPGGGPHGRNCPASYLHHWSASRNAVVASQAQVASPVALGMAVVGATATAHFRATGAAPRPEISPPLVSAALTPLPLRI